MNFYHKTCLCTTSSRECRSVIEYWYAVSVNDAGRHRPQCTSCESRKASATAYSGIASAFFVTKPNYRLTLPRHVRYRNPTRRITSCHWASSGVQGTARGAPLFFRAASTRRPAGVAMRALYPEVRARALPPGRTSLFRQRHVLFRPAQHPL